MSSGCYCDLDAPCEDPQCVKERQAEEAHMKSLFEGSSPWMSREEWEDAYRDNLAKAMAYPW